MNLKMIVVDLELSARQKRLMATAAVPVILGLASLAYAAPIHVWQDGDTLTAADLNGNFEELKTRITPWTPYTPTVKAGNATLTVMPETGASAGFWRRVGDTMEVSIATYHPTCQDAGALSWSLPPGETVDTNKLPSVNAHVGSGLTWNIQAATTENAAVLAQGDGVLRLQEPLGVVECSTIGDGGVVRMSFAVPIAEWTLGN